MPPLVDFVAEVDEHARPIGAKASANCPGAAARRRPGCRRRPVRLPEATRGRCRPGLHQRPARGHQQGRGTRSGRLDAAYASRERRAPYKSQRSVAPHPQANGPPRAGRRSLRSTLPALPCDRVGDDGVASAWTGGRALGHKCGRRSRVRQMRELDERARCNPGAGQGTCIQAERKSGRSLVQS